MDKTQWKARLSGLGKISPKSWMIVGLAGIVLIGLSSLTGRTNRSGETETDAVSDAAQAEEYRQTLCRQVTDLCNSLTGGKTVSVNVTLENEARYVYASETSENKNDQTAEGKSAVSTDSKTTYITVKKASGGEEALLVTRYLPVVRGVAVVVNHSVSEAVIQEIRQAVAAALGVSVRKIYVGHAPAG